jgi:hypothetical protein
MAFTEYPFRRGITQYLKWICAYLLNVKKKNMKKIRVYTLINIVGSIYGLTLVMQIISNKFFKLFYEPFAVITFSFLIYLVSSFIGLSKEIDLYKNLKGYIIDDNEKINWKLNNSFFLICAIIQLFSAFFPKFISSGIGGEFNYFLVALLPTFVFILRSFLKRITISESLGLLQLRRERIRTEDLEELQKKVGLEKWIENDPVLQKDKELFSKLVPLEYLWITYFDYSLKGNKDFILSLPNINYSMLDFISSVPYINIEESDLTNELMLKILNNSNFYFWGDSEFSKLFIKKVMDLYENLKGEDNLTPMPVLKAFFNIKNDLRSVDAVRLYPSLASFKECINHKHIIEKELEHCPYCN